MTHEALNHLLRAAGDLTGRRQFVLVGSAAIFAWHETIPAAMALSREADLYAFGVSEDEADRIADELEEIGQLSTFDETHGCYVDGVGPRTAVLPVDWHARAKTYAPAAANGVKAIVPQPEDLALSKLCAGREKDVDWVAVAFGAGLIDLEVVASRVHLLPDLASAQRGHIRELIEIVRRKASRVHREP